MLGGSSEPSTYLCWFSKWRITDLNTNNFLNFLNRDEVSVTPDMNLNTRHCDRVRSVVNWHDINKAFTFMCTVSALQSKHTLTNKTFEPHSSETNTTYLAFSHTDRRPVGQWVHTGSPPVCQPGHDGPPPWGNTRLKSYSTLRRWVTGACFFKKIIIIIKKMDIYMVKSQNKKNQQQLLTLHSRWEFCHCCQGLQDLLRTQLIVQPERLVLPLQLHARECSLFPRGAATCETTMKKNDTISHEEETSYWMKEIRLSSQRQQPQTSLQIPSAYAWVKLLVKYKEE